MKKCLEVAGVSLLLLTGIIGVRADFRDVGGPMPTLTDVGGPMPTLADVGGPMPTILSLA